MNKRSYTIFFVIIVCSVCALILSFLTSLLEPAQEQAKKIDQSKQMMIAAKILTFEDQFILYQNGQTHPARYDEQTQSLIPADILVKATRQEILEVYQSKIKPMLVNDQGDLMTFEDAGINYTTYIEKNQKSGYAKLPLKLVYIIRSNDPNSTSAEGYIFPINGFGLWDAIYGYLAIENNGDTVIGTTWYQQSETAGLGAEIATPEWQKQFTGKVVFQESADGQTNFSRAPLGIIVVKGTVQDVLGKSPKAKSAVDGISGASMTGEGVTIAYQNCLKQYRPFLLKLHNQSGKNE